MVTISKINQERVEKDGTEYILVEISALSTDTKPTEFNGQKVAPNLSKIASEGMYFSNFYSQVSVGTSSDSELTFNTSLILTISCCG